MASHSIQFFKIYTKSLTKSFKVDQHTQCSYLMSINFPQLPKEQYAKPLIGKMEQTAQNSSYAIPDNGC